MKRPKIRHPFVRQRGDYYLATDIDPLLDELERLKKLSDRLNDIRTWIIENTEDVTGQDGVKWNCIERDELLNYLKG